MSIVADFARDLHEKNPVPQIRKCTPIQYPCKSESLSEIRVAIFDVYGTLSNYWKPEFKNEETRQSFVYKAFEKTISYFGMEPFLIEMEGSQAPAKTLHDLYNGLITLKHEMAGEKKIEYPEVKIEGVWEIIVMMLKRRGYDPSELLLGNESDFAKCVAYFYNFVSFNRGLYPGVFEALSKLAEKNIMLGIVSNAQFYTPIDLTLFLRDQSNGTIDDYSRLFNPELQFFSYEYGVSKPNQLLFRKLFDALYEYQVLPSQTLFVGNDLAQDIKPAMELGMKTAFFTGDEETAFLHGLSQSVFPDLCFSTWDSFADKISFYSHSTQSDPATGGLI